MPRGLVCLTFDFDALSAWVSRGIVSATPLSRGEFAAVAVPRLLAVLERRSLPATWFVPAHTAKTYPGLCRELVLRGHEVALHGYAHENVATLDPPRSGTCWRGPSTRSATSSESSPQVSGLRAGTSPTRASS